MLNGHHCPVCGKEFFPTYEWVYKDLENIYCSWSCYRTKNKDRKTAGNYNYKKVAQYTKDKKLIKIHDTILDAAVEVNGIYPGIASACREKWVYKGYLWRYVK